MSRTRVPVVFMGLFLGALAVASVAGGGTRAFAADEKSDTDQAVLKMNAQCNEAELRADIAGMEACETDDFMHIHANGTVEHKAEFLKGIASGAHKFLALDLSEVHVRTYGDTAVVDEHMHLRANNNGRIADVQNLVMTVWTKQQGKWREAAWMAVGLPGSRAAAPDSK